MVPDKFNMIDMGGIDLIMAQGEEVSGLYNRLVESIAQCRYQCLYNWFFDGVLIPPSYVEMEVNENEEVAINEGVTVSSDDVIHIYSLGPGPVDPQIIPLLAEENGTYSVPTGVDGFDPVTVNVPSYTPVVQSLNVSENGTYNPPSGVDGYAPVVVDVPSYTPVIQPITITENGTYNIPSGIDGYGPIVVNVSIIHAVIVSVSGGYNGGAVVSVVYGETLTEVIHAIGDSPYNLQYTPNYSSATVDNHVITVSIPNLQSSTSDLEVVVTFDGVSKSASFHYEGGNTSYGYGSQSKQLTFQ